MNAELKFEEALLELENITRDLESGTLSLDKSLEVYERAVFLIKLCNGKLEEAEGRVKILLASSDGSVSAEDFGNNAN